MKFANVHTVVTSGRFALRLALFSFLCLMVFAMSSPRFGVAPAARAAQSQKHVGGKAGAAQTKAVTRASGKSASEKSEAKRSALKSGGDSVQPSVVCAQNQPITSGTPVNGTLTASDCNNPFPLPNGQPDNSKIDEYTFNGTAGQQVTVSMTSTAFDTVLYILDSNNNILAFNDDIDDSTTNSRISLFTLPANGSYSILANSFRPFPEEQGAYTLTLTGGATCNPTPIAYGDTKQGTLNSGDCVNPIDEDGTPVDFYTFNGTAGQQIAITMTTTSGNLDPYLYLLLPSGDLLADDDNGGGGTAARIPQSTGFGRLPVSGTYTIVANTLSASQTGNYNLTLTKAATDCASATITLGTTVNGSLATGDCRLLEDSSFIDAYTFAGTADTQVVITMTSSTGGLVPVLFLLSPNGDAIGIDVNTDRDNIARLPVSGTGAFTLPTTGNYTVLANSFSPGQTGNYTLRIVNPSACTTTLAATGGNVGGGGGQFNFNFTTQPGCTITATSNSDFITNVVGTADANGNGTVTYTVQANSATTGRTGTITVNGQTFTVTQGAATSCTYAVYPTVRPFTSGGGTNGRFTVITQNGCPWTATTNVSWITITEGAGTGSFTGTGRVRYTVAANTTNATRVGTITVNGVTHTVTQTSVGTTPQIQFSGNAEFTVNENDASRAATITVTRTGDTAGAATVEYATVDDQAAVPCDPNIKNGDTPFPQGTAYARCDYATTIDTLTFNAGETTKSFTVPLINDVFQENNETFRIALSNPQGATLGTPNTAIVTLVSDDLAPPTSNPINQTPFFVRQHYLDFLDREPEPGEPWSAVLANCPQNIFSGPEVNTDCDRIAVSGAFFGSPEFRLKGFFVFLHYKAAFGSANNPLYVPQYVEFVADARRVSGVTAAEVIGKRLDFSEDFLARTSVSNAFANTTNEVFVDRILANLGIGMTNPDPTSGETRNSLVNALNTNTKTRPQVLRLIVESAEAIAVQFNRAFVAIQYYGYLRRTPEATGYEANLNALNQTNNSRQLINGFLNSIEYRLRFGANTTNP
ncbi:MAG TPA: pre-peptidase C-terminal domain-containing protein [Pyrinomonadaceae bacterium]|nr:pre-peptidase C-terminal domain-containing protein [Pyrinomonadaceae bacterium]